MKLEKVMELLNKASKKHDRDLNRTIAEAKKSRSKYNYIPEFRPYKPSIPFFKRLGVFKTKNNFFDPVKMVAYSYSWWRFLEVRKGKVVFNNYSYSMQTSGHQAALMSVLRELGIKIDVEVEVSGGLQHFETNALPELYTRIIDLEVELSRKRSKPECNRWRRSRVRQLLKQEKVLRQLGAKLSRSKIKEMRMQAFAEEKSRVEKLEEQARQRKAIRLMAKTSQGLDLGQFASMSE